MFAFVSSAGLLQAPVDDVNTLICASAREITSVPAPGRYPTTQLMGFAGDHRNLRGA
jgi:hypothetical protein